jgi:MFS family permease
VTNPSQSLASGSSADSTPPPRRRLFLDLTPARQCPEYRRLWLGLTLSNAGNQITAVAVPVQMYDLTRSSLAVGLAGLAIAAPMIVLGLFGGAVADRMDRRRLVLVTSTILGLISIAFAAQAFAHADRAWLLYVLVAVQSGVFAVDSPARRTFVARLLPAEQLPMASALSQMSFQLALICGPLIAGLIISAWGFQICYLIDAVTFLGTLYGVLRMRPMPVQGSVPKSGPQAVAAGLRFLRGEPVVSTVMLVDLNATILGMPYALFPALAAERFGGAHTVGLLYAAPAVGGAIGVALSGRMVHVRRQGLALIIAIAVYGTAICLFGLSTALWASLILLAIAGAADMSNAVFRNTMIQVNTPDGYRGRVNGVAYIVGAGGPQLGNIEAGAVASLTSPAVSAFTGGLGCLVGVGLLSLTRPALARYRAARG